MFNRIRQCENCRMDKTECPTSSIALSDSYRSEKIPRSRLGQWQELTLQASPARQLVLPFRRESTTSDLILTSLERPETSLLEAQYASSLTTQAHLNLYF